MSDIKNNKRWFPFNFAIILQGRHFVVDGTKNIKLSTDISFERDFRNITLSNLLLLSCPCYWVDLDDIQCRPLFLNFSNLINLCPNIWFNENSKYQQFLFSKQNRQKEHTFFMFLRRRYFVMGGPINMNDDAFWDAYVGFLKCVVLPKYSQTICMQLIELHKSFSECPWWSS